MDNISEKLGLYDFFNVISVGAIFIVHVLFLFPDLMTTYGNWIIDNSFIEFSVLFIWAYVVGILFQEIGAFLDDTSIKLFNERKPFIKKRITRSFLVNKNVIENDFKLCLYRRISKEILANKEIEVSNSSKEDQTEYVYSHIEYYVESKNRNKKTEKMRALYGMSKSLFCSMFGLLGIWAIWLFCNKTSLTHGGNALLYIRAIIFPIYLIISAFVYYKRAERCMKYRVRMMLGVYESCLEDTQKVLENERK